MKSVILLSMIFCHIVDDYKIQQGVLCNLKQESWWKENAPDNLYKKDYIIALLMHGMSWSFMINLPLVVYCFISNISLEFVPYSFVFNAAIHAYTDDLKANRKKINLILDQLIHIVQIIITFRLVVT